jgi:hypothetical protein
MSMSGWSTPEDMGTWMADQGRKTGELERRVRVPSAKQILGPGLGPWAVRLFDWNDEKTLYNGVFYSEVGAANSPDPTKAWIGSSWATQDGRGAQEVTQVGTSRPVYRRTFATAPGATPVFTPWFVEGVWTDYSPAHSWSVGSGGILSGQYMLAAGGEAMAVRVGCTFGTGLTFPTGSTVGLPPGFTYSVAFYSTMAGVDFRALDVGTANYSLIGHLPGDATISMWAVGGAGAYSGSWPFTWAAGDGWTLEARSIRLLA